MLNHFDNLDAKLVVTNVMNGISGHDSALCGYTGPGTIMVVLDCRSTGQPINPAPGA